MKRRLRIIWTALAAASALLCLAIIALWLRQHLIQEEQIDYVRPGHFYVSAQSTEGRILVWWDRPWPWNDNHRGFHYGRDFGGLRTNLHVDILGTHPYPEIELEVGGFQALQVQCFVTSDTDGSVYWGEFGATGEEDIQPSIAAFSADVPIWYLILLFGAIPVVHVVWQMKRCVFARKPGFCVSCGYDLRATPNKCPECGTVPKAKGAI
jgi:hypothetical protein